MTELRAKTVLLKAFLVLMPFSAFASHDTYMFFDPGSCNQRSINNEPLNGNGGETERKFHIWDKKAKSMPSDRSWSVFVEFEDERYRFGICSSGRTSFQCLTESSKGFTLAGASFITSSKNHKVERIYRCTSGCTALKPKELFSQAYEGSDEVDLNYEKAVQKAQHDCFKAKR